MKKQLLQKFGLLVIALVLSAFISEAVARVYFSGKIIAENDEERCGNDMYKKISNPLTVNRFHPLFTSQLEYVNYSGIRPKANISEDKIFAVIREGEKYEISMHMVRTNTQHLKAFKEFDYGESNLTRIAIFGDSFTWGADVPFMYSFPAILERLIPNSEVLNFGIEGVGIDTMYLRWKNEVARYKPDVVVFAIYVDDIRRARPCMNKPRFTPKNGRLEFSNIPPPSNSMIYDSYRPKSHFSYLLSLIKYAAGRTWTADAQYDYGFSILKPILLEINETALREGYRFAVLLIEAGNQHTNSAVELEAVGRSKQLLRELNIPYTTAYEIFSRIEFSPSDTSGENFTHFSPESNGAIALGLMGLIEQTGAIEEQGKFDVRWRRQDNALDFTIDANSLTIFPYTVRKLG